MRLLFFHMPTVLWFSPIQENVSQAPASAIRSARSRTSASETPEPASNPSHPQPSRNSRYSSKPRVWRST